MRTLLTSDPGQAFGRRHQLYLIAPDDDTLHRRGGGQHRDQSPLILEDVDAQLDAHHATRRGPRLSRIYGDCGTAERKVRRDRSRMLHGVAAEIDQAVVNINGYLHLSGYRWVGDLGCKR